MAGVGLFGGAFDPPHLGHVEVAARARAELGLSQLVVLVSERPAHREVHLDAAGRLELARVAFPEDEVRLDPYPRTIELLRAERFDDAIFVVGADEFAGFLDWAEPDAVLELTRLAVATRPGYPRDRLEAVLAGLRRPDQVVFFDVDPNPAASRDLRRRAAASQPLDGLVPPAVARLVSERGFYGGHDAGID